MTVLKAVMPTSRRPARALRVAVCLAGFAACGLASVARADDETDELKDRFIRAFSIDKIGEATGLRKTEDEKAGIEYRERSPLVIPKSRDLPPPGTVAAPATPTNWPRDPGTGGKRKAQQSPDVVATQQPGAPEAPYRHQTPMFDSADWTPSAIFGKKKAEAAQFSAEPPRDSLTQPPVGYQTPSPDYAYGTGQAAEPQKFSNPSTAEPGH